MKKSISVIVVLTSMLYGCATIETHDFSSLEDVPNAYVKGVQNKETSSLWTGFRIVGINGVPVDFGWTGDHYESKIEVDQGSNRIVVEATTATGFYKPTYTARGEVTAYLEGGKLYQINGVYDGLIRMWIEEFDTAEKVSEIVSLSVQQVPISMPIFIPAK